MSLHEPDDIRASSTARPSARAGAGGRPSGTSRGEAHAPAHRDAAAVASGRLAGAVRTAVARIRLVGAHADDPYVRSVLEAVQTTLQVAGALRPQGRVDRPASLAPAAGGADADALRPALRAAAVDVGRAADAASALAGALDGRKSDALANVASDLRDAADLLLDLARPDALEALAAYPEAEELEPRRRRLEA